MARKGLLLLGFAAAAGLLLLFLFGGDEGRASSARAADGRGQGTEGSAAKDAAAAVADAAAYERDLQRLIAKHGGFRGLGRVLLLDPQDVGRGLTVRLAAQVDGIPVHIEAVTEDTGRFALGDMPRAGGYRLTIEGAQVQPFVLEEIELQEGTTHDFGDLELGRYYFVHGRVVSGGGLGIRDAEVALIQPAVFRDDFSLLQMAHDAGKDDPVVAATGVGPDGRFHIRLTRRGTFALRVRAKGYATRYQADVVVRAEGAPNMTIVMTEGYPVRGLVLDGSGRPLADAVVAVYTIDFRDFSFPKELTKTNGTGRFAFQLEPRSQEYWLNVMPPDSVQYSEAFRVPLDHEITVRMPGSGDVVGRVVDAETRQPIAGAVMMIGFATTRGTHEWPNYSQHTTTDDFGAFRVRDIGKAYLHSLTVRAPGYQDLLIGSGLAAWLGNNPELWRQLQKIEFPAEGETKLPDIPLGRGRVLQGRVLDAETKAPLSGATVTLWDFVMGNRSTRTGPDGVYVFQNVGPRMSMIARAPGYGEHRDRLFPGWFFPKGKQEATRDLELPGASVVEGTVATKDGTPIAGALVRLWVDGGPWEQGMALIDSYTHTDKQGRYRIADVAPRKIKAYAEAAGYDTGESAARKLEAGKTASGLDVTLLPSARIEGKVVDEGGRPVASAHLVAARDPKKDDDIGAQWNALVNGVSAFSDAAGRFLVPDVPVGDLILRIDAKGFATRTIKLPGVEAGAVVTDQKIELRPAFEIVGVITGPDGNPISHCWVHAKHRTSPHGEPTKQLMFTDVMPDGRFVLQGLPAGTYRVTVWPQTPLYERWRKDGITAGTKDLKVALRPRVPQVAVPTGGG
ncbi:MAG: carboxypeptidase regulatory-like domain-containing protein [Planctomycetota bacterium]